MYGVHGANLRLAFLYYFHYFEHIDSQFFYLTPDSSRAHHPKPAIEEIKMEL